MSDTAKIFWTGRSQAVRLPKAYRFEGTEVRIRREGDRVVLEATNDSAGLEVAAAGEIDRLRAAIREGLESGAAEPWDAEAIKRMARER